MHELIPSLAIVHTHSFVIFAFSYDQLSMPRRLTCLDAVFDQMDQ